MQRIIERNNNNYNDNLYILLGLCIPFLITFSPLIQSDIRQLSIFFWMLLFPLILFKLSSMRGFILMLVCLIILIAYSYNGLAFYFELTVIYLLPILVFIYVSLGKFRFDEIAAKKILSGLFFGAAFINIISLILFLLLANETLILSDIYELFGRSDELGIWRFSLGNAIEVPFLLTMCTVIGYSAVRQHGSIINFFLLLNIVIALIAQSRGVILISILHAVVYLRFIYTFLFVGFISFFLFFNPISNEIIFGIYESLLFRFSGEDYGSASQRQLMVQEIISNFTVGHIFIGSGLISSSELMRNITGSTVTAESGIFQFIYEFGLINTAILMLGFIIQIFKHFFKIPLYIWAAFIQLFLLLPITPSFGIFAVLFSLYFTNLKMKIA